MGRSVPWHPQIAVMVLLGALSVDALEPPEAELHRSIRTLVHEHSALVLHAALREWLCPSGEYKELVTNSKGARWVLVKELYCAKAFVDDKHKRSEVLPLPLPPPPPPPLLLRGKMELYSRP